MLQGAEIGLVRRGVDGSPPRDKNLGPRRPGARECACATTTETLGGVPMSVHYPDRLERAFDALHECDGEERGSALLKEQATLSRHSLP